MKKLSMFLLIAVIFSLLFLSTVNADVGPKPSLKVIVKNPPQAEYYLDLLVDYSSSNLFNNMKDNEIYSGQMYNILKDYNVDGWHPALAKGTSVPLNGKLTGDRKGNDMVHNFSYVGVPDRFKVIIVTSDNEIIISENSVDRKAFNSTVYFDCNTKNLSESSPVFAYLLQFLSTCSLTFIIEGIILVLFRFSMKQNWKAFLAINIITQILLTLIIFGVMYSYGSFAALLLYMPFELVIFIAEAILFAKYLKQHSKLRRVIFAITANIISFFLGIGAILYFPLI